MLGSARSSMTSRQRVRDGGPDATTTRAATPQLSCVTRSCKEQDPPAHRAVRVINIRPKYATGITGMVSHELARPRGDLMVTVDGRYPWRRRYANDAEHLRQV